MPLAVLARLEQIPVRFLKKLKSVDQPTFARLPLVVQRQVRFHRKHVPTKLQYPLTRSALFNRVQVWNQYPKFFARALRPIIATYVKAEETLLSETGILFAPSTQRLGERYFFDLLSLR